MNEATARCSANDAAAMRNINNWHREDMGETLINDTTVLLRHNRRHGADIWWLVVDGAAVAMVKTLHRPEWEAHHGGFVVCDIEVRDSHRGKGYGRTLIGLIEDTMGLTLYTSGNFTPEGYAAFAAHIPVYDGNPAASVAFESMTFVDDWDNLTLKHS